MGFAPEGNLIGGTFVLRIVLSVKTFLLSLSFGRKKEPAVSGSLCRSLTMVTSVNVATLRFFRKAANEKELARYNECRLQFRLVNQ